MQSGRSVQSERDKLLIGMFSGRLDMCARNRCGNTGQPTGDAIVTGDRDLLEPPQPPVAVLTPRALIERLDAPAWTSSTTATHPACQSRRLVQRPVAPGNIQTLALPALPTTGARLCGLDETVPIDYRTGQRGDHFGQAPPERFQSGP